MKIHTKTEGVSACGRSSRRLASRTVWRLALSTLLGIGASVVILGLFDYSLWGFLMVGAFWLIAAMNLYRYFNKAGDEKIDA